MVSKKRLTNDKEFLTKLLKAKTPKERAVIIKQGKVKQLQTLVGLVKEVATGKIPFAQERDKKKLGNYREDVERFVDTYATVASLKKAQLEEGFTEAILTTLPIFLKAQDTDTAPVTNCNTSDGSLRDTTNIVHAPQTVTPPTLSPTAKDQSQLKAPLSNGQQQQQQQQQQNIHAVPKKSISKRCAKCSVLLKDESQANDVPNNKSKSDILKSLAQDLNLNPSQVYYNSESETEGCETDDINFMDHINETGQLNVPDAGQGVNNV